MAGDQAEMMARNPEVADSDGNNTRLEKEMARGSSEEVMEVMEEVMEVVRELSRSPRANQHYRRVVEEGGGGGEEGGGEGEGGEKNIFCAVVDLQPVLGLTWT